MLRAMMLAAPLGAVALGAQAADIASTIKEQQQFSTLAEAIEAAGIEDSLQGEGPYTIFAPTDEAFDRLPQGVQDALMREENREQLKKLLQYHVVEGEELKAEDVLGKQSNVDTASGDRLLVDGTGQMILLVPRSQQQSAQGIHEEGIETAVAEESGMPASEHQQEVLAEEPATEERQTTAQGDMPASPHQEQVLRDQPAAEPQTGTAQAPTAQDMPSSPHQEQVLRGQQGQQADTMQPQTAQDMPASPHQEQVLRDQPAAEQRPGQQGQGMRAATVVEPDIEADNGVIHAVDALLVPQSVLSTLESGATSSEGESGSEGRAGEEQG